MFAGLGGTTTGWTFTGSTSRLRVRGPTTRTPTAGPARRPAHLPRPSRPPTAPGTVPPRRPSRSPTTRRRRPLVHVPRPQVGRTTRPVGAARSPGRLPTAAPTCSASRSRSSRARQLLRRQLVRERFADVADRDRDDELVVRARGGEADERQRLHRLSPRDRQRREHREHDNADVHLRHGGADVRDALARLADERVRHRHDCLLPQRLGRQLHLHAAAVRYRWVGRSVGAVPGDRDSRLDARQRDRGRNLAVRLLHVRLDARARRRRAATR